MTRSDICAGTSTWTKPAKHISVGGGCKLTLAAVLALASFGAIAANPVLKWTGQGDGVNWSDPNNWDQTPTWSSSVVNDLDFTALPANATISNDTPNVGHSNYSSQFGNITFGANKGTVTIGSSSAQNRPLLNGTWTIPAGTTVDCRFEMNFNWHYTGWTWSVTGGGTLAVNRSWGWPRAGIIVKFENITVNWNSKLTCYNHNSFELYDRAIVNQNADMTIGRVYTRSWDYPQAHNNSWTIAAGKKLVVEHMGDNFISPMTGAGNIELRGGGTMNFYSSMQRTFAGTITLYNGDLFSCHSAFSGANVVLKEGGFLRYEQPAAYAEATKISAPTRQGGVDVDDGKTFLFTGNANETRLFMGKIKGDGGIGKVGADSTLVLSGAGEYNGATTVSEGTLAVVDPYAARTYPSGIYAHYSFDASAQADVSGQGHNLVTTSTTAPAIVYDGKSGGCARYSKQGQQTAANVPCMSGNHPFTVALWMRPTEWCLTNKHSSILSHHYEWSNDAYGDITQYKNGPFVIFEKGMTARVGIGGMSDNTVGELADRWTHICITQTETQRKLYVNGTLLNTVTRPNGNATGSNSQPWQVVAGTLGVGSNFEGDVDEMFIFERALDADEVTYLYEKFSYPISAEPVVTVPAPVARWTFDDAENPGADSSGNGHHLTFTSGKTPIIENTVKDTYGNAWKASQWGGCFSLSSVPAALAGGGKSFTVSVRCTQDSNYQGSEVFFMGDMSTAARCFYISNGSSPLYVGPGGKTQVPEGHTFESPTLKSYTSTHYQHMVFVYNHVANKVYNYSDGQYEDSQNWVATTIPADGQLLIGCNPAMYASKGYWRGSIDDVQVFDCALSDAQVAKLSATMKDGGLVVPILPETTDVAIASGATLSVAASQTVHSLTGAGDVSLTPGATLGLASPAEEPFTGAIAGIGTVALQNGFTVLTDAKGMNLPVFAASSATAVGLPSSLELSVTSMPVAVRAAGKRTLTLFTGAIPANPDFSGWTVATMPNAAYSEARFFVEDGAVKVRLTPATGLYILFK